MPEVPIIKLFFTPPLELLQREIIPGVFTGEGTLDRVRGAISVDAFGLAFEFITVPEGYGLTPGNITIYEPRMVQISIARTLNDGHSVIAQNVDAHTDALPVLFDFAPPTEVQYSIAPGVYVQFFWLVVFT